MVNLNPFLWGEKWLLKKRYPFKRSEIKEEFMVRPALVELGERVEAEKRIFPYVRSGLEYVSVVLECHFQLWRGTDQQTWYGLKSELKLENDPGNRSVMYVPILIPRRPGLITLEQFGECWRVSPVPFSRKEIIYEIPKERIVKGELSSALPSYLNSREKRGVRRIYRLLK